MYRMLSCFRKCKALHVSKVQKVKSQTVSCLCVLRFSSNLQNLDFPGRWRQRVCLSCRGGSFAGYLHCNWTRLTNRPSSPSQSQMTAELHMEKELITNTIPTHNDQQGQMKLFESKVKVF